jgi:hypothetical protein
MRVASLLPFQATYYLNGHSFIEQELERAQIAFERPRRLPSAAAHRLADHHMVCPLCRKIDETCIIRLLEVLLHGGNNLGAWSAGVQF